MGETRKFFVEVGGQTWVLRAEDSTELYNKIKHYNGGRFPDTARICGSDNGDYVASDLGGDILTEKQLEARGRRV